MFLHSQRWTTSSCCAQFVISANLQNLRLSLGSENHRLIQSFDSHTFSRYSSGMEEDDTSSSDFGSNQV